MKERALKYLCFLVSPEALYRVALGMYNLPLALSVARRSTSMDPSEYTVLLNEFHRVQPRARQQFRIDDHLQRYALALKNLVATSDQFADEVIPYIKRHELYREAFELLSSSRPKSSNGHENGLDFTLLCKVYGQWEEARDNFGAACDLYALAMEEEQALVLAVKAGYWQKIVSLGGDLAAVHAVINTICSQKRFAEAFHLAQLRVSETNAIGIAIQGRLWDLLLQFPCSNLEIQEASRSAAENVLHDLDGMHKDFLEKCSRLEWVQSQLNSELDPKKLRLALESSSSNANAMGFLDTEDAQSLFSMKTGRSMISQLSGASTLASVTRASSVSRSKKKAEKNRMRGKPGSPFEREYLRDHLREQATHLVVLGKETHQIVKLLAHSQQFELARKLQSSVAQMNDLVRSAFERLRRLVQVQEERMTPELLDILGLTPYTIPATLLVDHSWKTAFMIPPEMADLQLCYL
jgi:elongator complex protein 1